MPVRVQDEFLAPRVGADPDALPQPAEPQGERVLRPRPAVLVEEHVPPALAAVRPDPGAPRRSSPAIGNRHGSLTRDVADRLVLCRVTWVNAGSMSSHRNWRTTPGRAGVSA